MYTVEEHWFTINRVLLKALGIWHHDESYLALLQRILIMLLLLIYLGMQLGLFITRKCNMDLFIKTMSIFMPYIIIVLKYCIFILKSKHIKQLYHRIQKNWELIQNKLESEILWKYIRQCHTYIILSSLLFGLVIISTVIIQFLPLFLDFITPLDEPRPRKIIIELFAPQEHFYIKVLHELIIIFICGLILLATSMQLLIFSYHCFGIFKVASCRIEYSIEDSLLRMSIYEQKRLFCKKIMHAVIAHRKAMELVYISLFRHFFINIIMTFVVFFCQEYGKNQILGFADALVSSFNTSYCFIIIAGVLSISISLYRFVDAAIISKNIEDAIISSVIISFQIIYTYLGNYIGQMISDYNYEIFESVYAISWYLIPVSSQKLLLFVMQKAGKDFTFTVGFLFTAKVESFALLMNTALSYVAVMLSTQEKIG